jgi:hypothetical protein
VIIEMPLKRICEACGKEFEVYPYRIKKGGGKYCSKMCSNKANAKIFVGENHHSWKGGNAKRICQECGKEFEIYQGAVKKGRGKYCSKACQNKAQSRINVGENHPAWKPKIKRICQGCGKEFEVIPSWIEHGHGKYCSYECAGKAKIGIFRGEKSPTWKGGKIKLTCQECGKEFEAYEASVKEGHKYCSTKCMGQGQSKVRIGKNSARWQGGISCLPYCEKFTSNLKERVRTFFSRRCALCGITEKENGKKLSVHHVFIEKMACCESKIGDMDQVRRRLPKEVAKFGEPEFDVLEITHIRMMVPLCKFCHGKAHGKRDEAIYRKKFSDLIMEKYNGKCNFDKEEFTKYCRNLENR